MKLISKIFYSIIATIFFCSVTLTTKSTFAIENTWQNAYMEVIESTANADSSDVGSSAYSLIHIDNDNIPELFMWDGKTNQVLYSYNNEAVLCKELSYRGTVWSVPKGKCFWVSDSSNAEYEYYDFHKLENGLCNVVYSFCIDRSEFPVERYLINNEEVHKEEYEAKIAELELACPLSPEYIINGNLEYSYDEIKQYLIGSIITDDSTSNTTTTVSVTNDKNSETTMSITESNSSETSASIKNESVSNITTTVSITNDKSFETTTTLPKTGYSIIYNYIILAAAAMVPPLGIFAILKSRKRDSE